MSNVNSITLLINANKAQSMMMIVYFKIVKLQRLEMRSNTFSKNKKLNDISSKFRSNGKRKQMPAKNNKIWKKLSPMLKLFLSSKQS